MAAYLTAKLHLDLIHTLSGYLLCVLLLARIFWGFAGNQYARFRSFCYSPRVTAHYLRSILRGQPRYYMGHNPAGALMVFIMLMVLILLCSSGLLTLAVLEFEGPLLFMNDYLGDETSYFIHRLHGWLAHVCWALIALHLAGVAASSMLHRQNLLQAMITGKKQKY